MKSLSGCLKIVVAFFGLLFLYGVIAGSMSEPSPQRNAGPTAATEAPAPTLSPEEQAASQAAAEAAARKRECLDWCYSEEPDAMSGRPARFAELRSDNELRLAFPYQGPQRARILVRQHPRMGHDVIVSIPRGQIRCEFRNCRLLIRIGDGQPRQWAASEPSDGASNVLFIADSRDFERQLIAAREVAIELELFQQGRHTLIFRPSENLVPPKAG